MKSPMCKIKADYQYLFGPVPSRRFGRSLGIDLTPFKTCSLDCIFCQLGHTTRHTSCREEYVPLAAVKNEILEWLENDGQADQITLAGSGEPTLHSGFGEVINIIKAHTDIPVAVLTNGTTLHLPEVRAAASKADIIKISLSAWDQASLIQVNRPCEGLTFQQLFEGERQFRQEFSGQLWLEVFLMQGINSMVENVVRIAGLAKLIKPDRIQLNTCVRPPAEEYAQAMLPLQMSELAELFEPIAEVIADFSSVDCAEVLASEKDILDMLRRRPCTAAQIAEVFGMHLNEVAKYVGRLVKASHIKAVHKDQDIYYIFTDENR